MQVFASTKPNANSGLVNLGSISIPAINQNSLYQAVGTITLPSRPKGFPAMAGRFT